MPSGKPAEGLAHRPSPPAEARSPRPALCVVHMDRAVLYLAAGQGRPDIGGAEVQWMHLVRGLMERGWAVRFVVPDLGQPSHLVTDEGVELLAAFRPRSGLPVLRFLTRTVNGLWQAMARADADVYLLRGATWITALLALFCRLRRRKWIFWLASLSDAVGAGPMAHRLPRKQRWLYRYGLKRADIIVCQTDDQARLLQENYGLDATVIPNVWPDGSATRPAKADPPEVLWAGRVMPIKRPHMVLDVAERLPDIRFVLMGGPGWGHDALLDSVRSRAQGMANVEVIGFIPFEETDRYYQRASALLCTSTVEGFPNTFLQAWAAHTPVVSTYDPDEVLCRYGLGFHCADVDEIAGKLALLCRDPKVQEDVGERCYTHLTANHAPAAVLPRVHHNLSLLLGVAGHEAQA